MIYGAHKYPVLGRQLALLLLLPALVWLYLYIFKLRLTGPEVFGGRIWWNDIRPIHAMLYASTAYLAYTGSDLWLYPLMIDVGVGFTAWAASLAGVFVR